VKACFTSRTSYNRGRFDHISGATGLVDFISGSTGYIREVYITGEDGEWCRLSCSGGAFTCDDLLGCNVLYSTGHQTLSGDLTVTGNLSGSSLYIDNCNLAVTTGGRIGIGTCDPQCDVDIYGNICHSSGNFINYSGYISGVDIRGATGTFTHVSGQTGIFNWLSGTSGYIEELYSTQVSGQTGIFNWLSGHSGFIRDRLSVGTGTPDSQFQVGDILRVEDGDSVRVSGQLWITGSDGAPCQVLCESSSDCALTDWVEAFEEDTNGDLQPTDSCCVNDTAWLLRANGDLALRANYFSCCGSSDIMIG